MLTKILKFIFDTISKYIKLNHGLKFIITVAVVLFGWTVIPAIAIMFLWNWIVQMMNWPLLKLGFHGSWVIFFIIYMVYKLKSKKPPKTPNPKDKDKKSTPPPFVP